MTVVAGGDAVIGAGGLDLIILDLSVGQAFLLESGLEKSAAPAAAEVVGFVGGHVHKVLFPHHGFHHKPQIIGNGVSIAFTDDLTGILHREFDFQVLVPVGVDLEAAFPDPFGIVLINVLDFKIVFDVEFLQSGPD
jgi:hypothetical protein